MIATKDGNETKLVFYWTGKNGVVFTRNGEKLFGGRGIDADGHYIDGGMCLRHVIVEAFRGLKR